VSFSLGFWTPIHCGEFAVREARAGNKDDGFDAAREVAELADAHGIEYTLVAARYYGATLEPVTTASALAMVTRQLRFVVALHSGLLTPQMVAKMGASLDQLSEGRFHLNLISGWWEEQHLGYGGMWLPHDERYALSDEFIQVIKGMWTREPFSFQGKYYQLENARLEPKPYQKPYPPSFLGGKSPPARELAAKECEWYFISGAGPDEIPGIIRDVRERAARYGRQIRFAVSGFVLLRDSVREAERDAQRLRELGERDPLALIHTKGLVTDWVGSPERIVSRFRELEDMGVEMALMQMAPIREEMRRFCASVVPLMDLPRPTTALSA
jgi:FMNH2-dependent dimethyl sulfone monooxygenase